MSNFGSRLRETRKASGLSQKVLASLVDTSQSMISQLENGERDPSLGLLRRLAKVLEVSQGYLLGEHQGRLSARERAHLRQLRKLSDKTYKRLSRYLRDLIKEES